MKERLKRLNSNRHSSILYLVGFSLKVPYYIEYSALFYIENDAEMFPAHYTWKVAEKEFKMAFMMNKLAMINYCEIILEI
jgi:hypothetical protein